jgi:hypothetical protein
VAQGASVSATIFTYRLVCAVPLTTSRRVWGTLVEVWERDHTDKLLSHKAWFTDLAVDVATVAAVVRLGRSRWKSENEQFHVILERGDRLYQRCLATTSRRELWHTMRTTMRMGLVVNWSRLLLTSRDEEGPAP